MTRFLVSDDNENGYRLEDILTAVRADVVKRCGKIVDDHRDEAHHVLENNIQVLSLLSKAIKLAEDSTHVLDKSFGPSSAAEGGEPRIGRA
ncbi:hypothetical protein QMT40_002650 [Parvibaculaceae bacterium PLY_AMNH_Bact1]|nr:hypothetical protein QMT40_002650 [Parvibaculaceae bacterium PLY_AMNH_Bact1]